MGFFGLPLEGKYQQSITIEEDGVRLLIEKLYLLLTELAVQQYFVTLQDV